MAQDPSSRLPESLAGQISEVESDRKHGASWLARRAATILAGAADDALSLGGTSYDGLLLVQATARSLVRLRPSMAAVANTVALVAEALYPLPEQDSAAEIHDRLARVQESATQASNVWATASHAIFTGVRPLLGNILYTFSRSATVEYACTALAGERPAGGPRVIVSQSHPGDEGTGLARRLAEVGMDVWLVPDGACGIFLGDVEAVIVGADSVRADGSVVNKVGTFPLALAAREARVPVYVLCETMKVAAPDFPLRFEEMDPSELLATPVVGVTVRNVYFDRTPGELIGKIVSEQGMLTPDTVRDIADRAGKRLSLLTGSGLQE